MVTSQWLCEAIRQLLPVLPNSDYKNIPYLAPQEIKDLIIFHFLCLKKSCNVINSQAVSTLFPIILDICRMSFFLVAHE
jgi:hypothetical protein